MRPPITLAAVFVLLVADAVSLLVVLYQDFPLAFVAVTALGLVTLGTQASALVWMGNYRFGAGKLSVDSAAVAPTNRKERYLSRTNRILQYVNRKALDDLVSATEPQLVVEQVVDTSKRRGRFAVGAKTSLLSAEAHSDSDQSVRRTVETERTMSYLYDQLEKRLIVEGQVVLGLDELRLPELHARIDEIETTLVLLEGRFEVIREEKGLVLVFDHPHIGAGQEDRPVFRAVLDSRSIQQSSFFLPQTVNATVLAQMIGLEEGDVRVLNLLPVVVY